jgi:hypothetical protein
LKRGKNLVRPNLSENFLEIKNVIRNWIHKYGTLPGMPAANLMLRLGTGRDLRPCTNLEGVDRQQDQNSMKRFELDI